MKIIFTIITLLISINVFPQSTAKQTRANIEIALLKTGVLIRRESKQISIFKDVEFHKLVVDDLVSKARLTGLQISYFYKGEKKGAFIDNDELKTLIKAVEMVRDKRLSPEENVDYKFMCRSGLSMMFTFYQKQWGMFLDLGDDGDTKPIFIHELSDVVKLINILNEAVI